MNLKTRIEELETKAAAKKRLVPGLVYITPGQSFEEAKADYKKRHGFDLPVNAAVIEIQTVDCRRGC